MRTPTWAAASCTGARATSIRQSPISAKQSASIYAYAYYNRSAAYRAKRDYHRALADFNEAIRLDPKIALIYADRCTAYDGTGDPDRAIADCSRALDLDPGFALAYSQRGRAFRAKGDSDHAIADYSDAIRLDPKDASAYFVRGRLNLHYGPLPKSLADLTQASALHPKDAYIALWFAIASLRSGRSEQWADATRQIDMTRWPAPLIRLYLGQAPPEAVLAAADVPDPVVRKKQVCEANLYSGELALQRGEKAEATRLLRAAAADCPKTAIEYEGAVAELKKLALQP